LPIADCRLPIADCQFQNVDDPNRQLAIN